MNKMIVISCLIMSAVFGAVAGVGSTNEIAVKVDNLKSAVTSPRLQEAQLWSSQVVTVMKAIVSSFNDGVTITGDQIIKFSETKLGKTVMIVAIWKIIGQDVFSKVVGLICFGLLMIVYFRFIKFFYCDKIVTLTEGDKKVDEYIESLFYRLWDMTQESAFGAFLISFLLFTMMLVTGIVALNCFLK